MNPTAHSVSTEGLSNYRWIIAVLLFLVMIGISHFGLGAIPGWLLAAPFFLLAMLDCSSAFQAENSDRGPVPEAAPVDMAATPRAKAKGTGKSLFGFQAKHVSDSRRIFPVVFHAIVIGAVLAAQGRIEPVASSRGPAPVRATLAGSAGDSCASCEYCSDTKVALAKAPAPVGAGCGCGSATKPGATGASITKVSTGGSCACGAGASRGAAATTNNTLAKAPAGGGCQCGAGRAPAAAGNPGRPGVPGGSNGGLVYPAQPLPVKYPPRIPANPSTPLPGGSLSTSTNAPGTAVPLLPGAVPEVNSEKAPKAATAVSPSPDHTQGKPVAAPASPEAPKRS